MSIEELKEALQRVAQQFYDANSGGDIASAGKDFMEVAMEAAVDVNPDDDDWMDGLTEGARNC